MTLRKRMELGAVSLLGAVMCVSTVALGKPPTAKEVEQLDSAQAREYYTSNTDWSSWGDVADQSCSPYKEFFGPQFTCTIDRAAAEEFYWAEAHKPAPERNQNNLAFACGSNSLQNMETPLGVCKDSKKCSEDWKAKIKGIQCRLVKGDVGPSLTLEKGILVFNVGYPKKGMRPGEGGYYWWINRDLYKLFPVYKEAYKASGRRDDIF